jgi:hypothetical protein
MDLPRDKEIPWGKIARTQATGIWEQLVIRGFVNRGGWWTYGIEGIISSQVEEFSHCVNNFGESK